MIVLKVGGSLFEHPQLANGLQKFMSEFAGEPQPFLIVPGGGRMADEVRQWDRIHSLTDDAAHWLAIGTLAVTARFLSTILESARIVPYPPTLSIASFSDRICILDPAEFCQRDDSLPCSWDVTSDSIAARVAQVVHAQMLVLLKSVDIPEGISWEQAAHLGLVDSFFPIAIQNSEHAIRTVNFRIYLDQISASDSSHGKL